MNPRLALPLALLLAAAPASAAVEPGPTPPKSPSTGTEADHQALRAMKERLTTAINQQDFEAARKLVHTPMLATAVTQDSFSDFDAMAGYFKSLFTRDTLRMKSVKLAADADELSQIYTGTFAVTRGSTKEDYELADGRSFQIKGRWTATSIKDADGNWKLLAIHSGTNFLDNPVLAAIEKSVMWVGAGAGLIGLVLGFLLGRWRRRKA